MNRLAGTLVTRESSGAIARVTVTLGSSTVTAVLLEDASLIPEKGSPVTVCFKESETALALEIPVHSLSIRNRLACRVVAVEDDGILANIRLDYDGSPLCALITTESARDLGISPGKMVNALIKSTEVMIERKCV
jgi:molybdopterin-binding protein